MTAALLFAVLLLQGNMAPTFSEEPEAPAPALAQPSPPAPKAASNKVVSTLTVTATPTAAADPVSCQIVTTTGTRFSSKLCQTRSQWEQQAKDARDLYNSWSGESGTDFRH